MASAACVLRVYLRPQLRTRTVLPSVHVETGARVWQQSPSGRACCCDVQQWDKHRLQPRTNSTVSFRPHLVLTCHSCSSCCGNMARTPSSQQGLASVSKRLRSVDLFPDTPLAQLPSTWTSLPLRQVVLGLEVLHEGCQARTAFAGRRAAPGRVRSSVLGLEVLHEGCQALAAFAGHRVVDRRAHAAH